MIIYLTLQRQVYNHRHFAGLRVEYAGGGRAEVLEQGCVNAFLGDSPRSHRPRDLLG